jgi:hypothetical protein
MPTLANQMHSQPKVRRLLRFIGAGILCAALAALFVLPARAQTTGSIVGKATDPSGAVVVGATVKATNQETGFSRQTTTDDFGQFILTLLPVGKYTLNGEKSGFEVFVLRDVVVLVNQNVRADIALAVGKVTQTVSVQASGAVVETRSATLGEVVSEKQILELPLNQRNFLNLATLQAGVVPAMTITSNNTPAYPGGVQAVFHVNGLRLQSNNFLLDGADNNEPFLGAAMSTPSPDALEEFKILTNNYSAEFGGGGGSIVNIITRQGTNRFRGTVYDFFRNDALDARNPFAQSREKLRRNQFGASLGGPIIHDKTFFFANYEGFRSREGITRVATVPTTAQRMGNFGPGLMIPPGTFNPVAVNLLPLIPPANQGTNQFVSSPVSENNSDQFTIRGDHAINAKNYLSARYHFNQGKILRNFTNTLFGISIDLPTFPLEDDYRLQNFAVADTHFFSSVFTNEARFAFNRGRFDSAISKIIRTPASFGFNLPSTKPEGNMPLIAIAGFTAFGTFNDSPSFRRENVYQYQDTLSYIHGKHAFKGGIDFDKTQMNIPRSDSIAEGAYLFVGAATGNAFADFLTGQPFLFVQAGGVTTREWRYSSFNFFVQDEYRVRPNITITMGVRYELPLPPTDSKNRVVALRPGVQSVVNPTAPLGLLFVGDTGITRSTIATDKNNIAPRLGVAWDVRGDGKYSVRAAYGVFFDRIIGLIPFQFGLDPPFDIIPAIPFPFIPSFGDPFNGMSPFQGRTAQQVAAANIFPAFSFLQVMDPKMRTPYVQQWNLTGQWQALKDMVVQVAYVGSKSTKLPQAVEINSARPTRPFAPAFLQLSSYQTAANATYNALQVTANKRLGNGLSLLGSYTWSKSIDGASNPVNFLNPSNEATYPQDRLNLRAEKGRSAYDARHRFVLSALYELPFLKNRKDAIGTAFGNWQVNGIITEQTGFPFTVLDSSDPNQDGDATDRPDIIGNPFAGAHSPSLFFNPAAFAHPAAGNDGNAGRNILTGPGIANVDFSIFKNFPVWDTRNVQFRAEFFNLINHVNFDIPVNDINSPNAGAILRTRLPSRQIQFALKFNF